MLKHRKIAYVFAAACVSFALTSCAAKLTKPPINHPDEAIYEGQDLYDMDPYEPFNRSMFSFNNQFNRYVAQPIADVYDYVPYEARKGIANVFINVGSPATIGNDLLQGNFIWALQDSTRFVLNTTLGLFGLFDVAADAGLPPRKQGFNLTLAKWGVTYSPYLVLPVLGPTTVRGGIGIVVDYYTSVYPYIRPYSLMYSVDALYFIQTAAGLLPKQDMIGAMALDPYLALRTAYLQNSDYLVQQVKCEGPCNEDN